MASNKLLIYQLGLGVIFFQQAVSLKPSAGVHLRFSLLSKGRRGVWNEVEGNEKGGGQAEIRRKRRKEEREASLPVQLAAHCKHV